MRAGNRRLLLAAALAALLAGLVAVALHAVERPDEAARTRREADARALPFRPAEAVALSIAPRDGAAASAVRDAGGWRLAGGGAASTAAIEGLLDRLASARVRATVPANPDTLATRGLAPPAARVTVTLGGGAVLTLDLGDESPFDRARFARRDGPILVVDGVPGALLDPDPARLLSPPGGG